MSSSETTRDDRQLPASERRLQKAADDGQVARSRDLGHSVLIAAVLLAMGWFGAQLQDGSIAALRQGLGLSRELMTEPTRLGPHLASMAGHALSVAAPTLALLAFALASASLASGGFVFSLHPLRPSFSRLSPASGMARLFNRDVLVDLVKLLVFASLLTIAGGWYTWSSLAEFAQAGSSYLNDGLGLSFATIQNGLWLMFVLMLLATVIDVPLQRHRHQSNLRMTLQEVRDEHKEVEGDPQIKSRIRARQQQIGRARMLSEVPKADVIITNPSHFAVAVRYDDSNMGAPVVVAKGADHLAARIREIATYCEIPFVEAPPLARALYAHVEVGREIPAVLYQAVAQVLAYVYQLRHWQPGKGQAPIAPHSIVVPAGLDPDVGSP